ncbi:MAG TPA: DUF1638 domain-containing protein, partial [Longilinea sp.]|nr:DUF1638 domain-containing protein [Longilinea sp.]
ITCESLARPVYHHSAASPHIMDVELVEIGLHNTPDVLRAALQEKINAVDPQKYQAVVLGYALCGRATHGLKAAQIPLVIPRAHDCITLFLGSRSRYDHEFSQTPGTYWYEQDYVERGNLSDAGLALGTPLDGTKESVYQEYVQKYGKDNAEYLMEVMGAWQQHYERAAWIETGMTKNEDARQNAGLQAEKRKWRLEHLAGDLDLVRKLLFGEWDDDFLIVDPGKSIEMSNDDNIICAA